MPFSIARVPKIDKVLFNLKFISSSDTIRGKLNFNKYNKRRNVFFKGKLVTRCNGQNNCNTSCYNYCVRYNGRTSSGKKQHTMHNVFKSQKQN